jgi:predicted transcriptional regulator
MKKEHRSTHEIHFLILKFLDEYPQSLYTHILLGVKINDRTYKKSMSWLTKNGMVLEDSDIFKRHVFSATGNGLKYMMILEGMNRMLNIGI